MEPLAGLLGAAGFALGLAADRLATRWPEHDEEHPPGRRGRLADRASPRWSARSRSGCCALRFGGDPLALAIFGAWFVTLIVGLATDLDQRLLPDVLTLPVIPVALRLRAERPEPARRDRGLSWPSRPRSPSRPSCTCRPSRSGPARSGWATSSCSSGSGCWPAASARSACAIFALLLAGVVLVVLLATRRIGRQTYVPFGPFLIIGALWAVLLRP